MHSWSYCCLVGLSLEVFNRDIKLLMNPSKLAHFGPMINIIAFGSISGCGHGGANPQTCAAAQPLQLAFQVHLVRILRVSDFAFQISKFICAWNLDLLSRWVAESVSVCISVSVVVGLPDWWTLGGHQSYILCSTLSWSPHCSVGLNLWF